MRTGVRRSPSLKDRPLPKTRIASPTVTANPHSWMEINPDPKHTPVDFMFGVLEREHAGRANSAVEFVTVKLQPVPPADGGPAITAERAGVVLPRDADDRFADPFVLASEVDRMAVPSKPALLAYITLYFPQPDRLHHIWRDGMAFAQGIADEFGVATIAALHVPWRAGSANPVHLHLMMMGPRRLTALGLTTYEHGLCFMRGQKLLADRWAAHRG